MTSYTFKNLPVDPRWKRLRSVEVYNEKGQLVAVGRSCPQGYPWADGTYAEAQQAVVSTLVGLEATSKCLDALFGQLVGA